MVLKGFPNGVTWGQQYNIGEKPTVTLYIYHVGTQKHTVCCVCVFSSHSLWTSSLLDVPAGVTQEEGHTEFLINVRQFFSREGFSHSFPSSTVKSEFVY